jgi:thiol-disulfide isomerase/thioredoxin
MNAKNMETMLFPTIVAIAGPLETSVRFCTKRWLVVIKIMCSELRCHLLLLSGLLLLNVSATAVELQEEAPAPTVRAELLDGGTFDSMKQRGEVIVLNFWASWCNHCRKEMPALDAYYRAHHAEGLEMIAISIEEPGDLAKVKGAMKDFSFPAALASSAQTEG